MKWQLAPRNDSQSLSMKVLFLLLASFVPILGTLSANDIDPFSLPSAKDKPQKTESQVRLLSEVSALAPGQSFSVALKLTHPKGWHSYYINSGLIGESLKVKWTLPEGYKAQYLGWPTPHLSESFGFQTLSLIHI